MGVHLHACVFTKVSGLKECRDIIASGFFYRHTLWTWPPLPNLSQTW